jgi:hypothetical protein
MRPLVEPARPPQRLRGMSSGWVDADDLEPDPAWSSSQLLWTLSLNGQQTSGVRSATAVRRLLGQRSSNRGAVTAARVEE